MMSEELETARRYRLHAEELRIIAEAMGLQPNRHVLLQVAADYDQMARALERRGQPEDRRSMRVH
jgi:predicted homoserine dehydrogenase-like protein